MKKNHSLFMLNIQKYLFVFGIFCIVFQNYISAQSTIDFTNPPSIDEFLGNQPMTRAGRPFQVMAIVSNPSDAIVNLTATLVLPKDIKSQETVRQLKLNPKEKVTLKWTLNSTTPLYEEVQLKLSNKDEIIAVSRLPIRFLPSVKKTETEYIPEPVIPTKKNKKLLVGAHNCPLWEFDSYNLWSQLKKHPERTPALGFYAQENPEVADWETKWAAEHGVDFFIYCWYRTSQGGPVQQKFGSAIHEALFNSKFQDKIKFTIMWENQSKGTSGVKDEKDLMENLLPFWIENYFKKPNYLLIDNKPVLYIYRPEFLVEDLGSIENVQLAFDKMRKACQKAGFDGLWLLGEYRGSDPKHLGLMKGLGLDYTFAYCWHVTNSPNPPEAITSQMAQIKTTQDFGIIPQVVTVSQAWSGWRDEGSIWKLPPTEFETLLRRGKAFVEQLPDDQLSGQMLILDNWNEWGEGHYLLPYTEYGFGYLDAIRKVFTNGEENHVDLIPDIGMGPYENAYREYLEKKREEK